MKLKNLTRSTIFATDLKEAKTFGDKVFGLLKKSNPRSLLFKTRFGIYTFGLKNPIDVLVLDNNFGIVKLKTVSPNSFFFWNPKYNLVIELPENTIKKSKTKVRDKLKLFE